MQKDVDVPTATREYTKEENKVEECSRVVSLWRVLWCWSLFFQRKMDTKNKQDPN